jgi:hypothetical protein
VDYVADDIVAITKRLKEISAGEASIQNSDLDIAAGRDLDFLARECCLYRNVDEGDYLLRNRVGDKLSSS